MGEHHPTGKPGLGIRQRLTHIAEQKEPRWRHAIRMCGKGSLADIDRSIREEFAKMIVSASVAEAEFQHRALQFANQTRRQIEAGSLSLKPSYKAVESAHEISSSDPGRFAQAPYFGNRSAQLIVCRFEPMR